MATARFSSTTGDGSNAYSRSYNPRTLGPVGGLVRDGQGVERGDARLHLVRPGRPWRTAARSRSAARPIAALSHSRRSC
ncbi:hypothetical protein ACFSTC_00545 [Nonomuraea ferruginea]